MEQLLISNSLVKINKIANAEDLFNQQVVCYEFSLVMVKDLYSKHLDRIEHLRDLNPENLDVLQCHIYGMLLKLPERLSSDDLFSSISDTYHNDIKRIVKSHELSDFYYIRAVMMYGIAEIRRSFKCGELLKKGDFESFGRMMNISHDGYRVSRLSQGSMEKYEYDISDNVLHGLIDDL